VALLLGLAGIRLRTESRHRTAAADALATGVPAPAIAVLPFALQDEALANWHEGLMDLVSMDLSGIPGFRAVDSRTVLARWREAVVGRDAPALATALDVAERAGGRYAVAGSVIADGPDLILTAGVHELAGRRMLGTARARGPADSIFALVDRLALEILRLMPGGDARDLARIDLARVNTASLPALKAFLEGEVRFRRSQFESAADAFGRAVEADSTFALARYRLGRVDAPDVDEAVAERPSMAEVEVEQPAPITAFTAFPQIHARVRAPALDQFRPAVFGLAALRAARCRQPAIRPETDPVIHWREADMTEVPARAGARAFARVRRRLELDGR